MLLFAVLQACVRGPTLLLVCACLASHRLLLLGLCLFPLRLFAAYKRTASEMPTLRVKVDNRPGQAATRVEVPADALYQQGLATVLGAVGLNAGQGMLSLNKKVRKTYWLLGALTVALMLLQQSRSYFQVLNLTDMHRCAVQEPVNLGADERMFQGDGFRPGDLVWVVVSDPDRLQAQPPLQPAAEQAHTDTVMETPEIPPTAVPPTQPQGSEPDSEPHVPTMDAGPAFEAACMAIRAAGTSASATTICRCIVQSCFWDSGCTATRCQHSHEQQADAAMHGTSGVPKCSHATCPTCVFMDGVVRCREPYETFREFCLGLCAPDADNCCRIL